MKTNDFIKDIVRAKKNDSLFCFIGAGVSISQGYPDWDGYVKQLINFWTYHLNSIVKDDQTESVSLKMEDIKFLEILQETNISNKRKVDIVNYLIKKYCISDTDYLSRKKYSENALKFERLIFDEIKPIVETNSILEDLIRLRAIYLTTNFDNEISKAYSRVYNKTILKIQNLKDIPNQIGAITGDTVIHLHGTPQVNFEDFISSSDAYTKMYYNSNTTSLQFNEIFNNRRNSVLLFVGCSMEEDEIVSLLSNVSDVQVYALMRKTSDSNTTIAEYYNDCIQEFYRESKNINIIWYGDSFKELPEFVELLVNSVISEEQNEIYLPNPDDLKTSLIAYDNESLNTINLMLENSQFELIDTIISGSIIQSKGLNVLLSSEKFLDYFFKQTSNFPKIWEILSTNTNILDNDQINLFLHKITYVKFWNRVTSKSMINFILSAAEKIGVTDKINFVAEKLKFMFRTPYLDESVVENNLQTLWLLNKIQNNDDRLFLFDEEVKFNFKEEQINDFIKGLDKLSINHRFYFNLESNNLIKTLIILFEKSRICFEGYSADKIPQELYNIDLIQRIFVYIFIKNDVIETNMTYHFESIVKRINFDDKYLGSMFNEFVKKYYNEILEVKHVANIDDGYFKDHFTVLGSGPVSHVPIYEIDNIVLKDTNQILSRIKDFKENEITNFVDGKYIDIGHVGQSNHFIDYFSVVTNWESNKDADAKKLIELLLGDNDLVEHYEESIGKILFLGYEFDYFSLDYVLDTLQNLMVNLSYVLNHSTYSVIEKIIQSQDNRLDPKVINFVFNIVIPSKHNFEPDEILNDEGLVDLFKFSNSSIGRYFSLIELFPNDVLKANIDIVNNIFINLDNSTAEYSKGRLIFVFVESRGLRSSANEYIGFSHRYRISNDEKLIHYFKESVIQLLDSTLDRFLEYNTAYVLSYCINPALEDSAGKIENNLASSLFLQILDFAKYNYDPTLKYLYNWIDHFIFKYSLYNQYTREMINLVRSNELEAFDKLITRLSNGNVVNSSKIEPYLLSRGYLIDGLEIKQLLRFRSLVIALLKCRLVIINSGFYSLLEEILEKQLSLNIVEESKNFIKELAKYISIDEIKKLNLILENNH